ncbi:MAG TPA: tetratricopeptide repeat protein [Candidatus Dormibacteraeota bacterium]|nr:tetratricopeptide repeat protein [Candidatus Dormibacteraeota bacterium]
MMSLGSPAEETSHNRARVEERIVEAACAVATFLVFSRTLWFEFVYDDTGQILKNGMLKSWQTFSGSLGAHVWKDLYPFAAGNYYRPLFVFWLFVNRWAFHYRPAWWHFTTLLMHVAACVLALRISRKIGLALYPAAFCALVFGIHPVHLESAAWVSGVNDSLMAVPLLASYLCYLNWKESGSGGWMFGSLTLFAASLLAKETAAVLPLVVFADLWIDRGSRPPNRVKKVLAAGSSMLAVLGVYLGLRWVVLGGLGHMTIRLPLSASILTWPKLLCFYLRLLVFPVGLSEFYDTGYAGSLGSWKFILPFLVLVMIGGGLWYWQRQPAGRLIRFGIVWLLAPVLLVLNLGVFPRGEFAHDRYLYLSVLGFAVLISAALARIGWVQESSQPHKSGAAVFALLLLACLGISSVYQAGFWANDLALFGRANSIAPHSCTAANNLGSAYVNHGRLEEARLMYEAVSRQCPNYWLSIYNLGYLNYRAGNQQQAEAYLLRAIELDPSDGDEYMYLGMARYRMNRLSEALVDLRQAIELRPMAPGYHFTLGVLLEQVPDWEAARLALEAEIRVNPDNALAVKELERCRRKIAIQPIRGTPHRQPSRNLDQGSGLLQERTYDTPDQFQKKRVAYCTGGSLTLVPVQSADGVHWVYG